jgi:hypothetical protein
MSSAPTPPTATLAQAAAPRAAGVAPPTLPGPGLPHDRHARIAARRTFVALKHRFMAAVADVGGQRADWLRFQVRQAQDPVDLWLLRGLVFDALSREGPATERMQAELSRVLDNVFPDSGELMPFGVRR